jgi:hypothetical protein
MQAKVPKAAEITGKTEKMRMISLKRTLKVLVSILKKTCVMMVTPLMKMIRNLSRAIKVPS